jgi:hypothetical protein
MNLFELVALIVGFLSLLVPIATVMVKFKVSGWKYRLVMIVASLIVHGLVTIAFSQELLALGKTSTANAFRPGLLESFQLYPHLVFFPLVLGYVILFFLWMASEEVWRRNARYVIFSAIAASVLGGAATYLESSGEAMMLIEFEEGAFRNGQFSPEDQQVFREVETYLRNPEISSRPPLESLAARERLFSFDQTWASREKWSPKARLFYLLVFFYVISLLAYSLFLSLAFIKRPPEMSKKTFRSYCFYMMTVFGVFLLWIPCRIFYNVKVKGPVFSAMTRDSIFGVKIPSMLNGVTSSEIAPLLLILIFLGAFCAIHFLRISEARNRFIVFLGLLGAIFLFSSVLAVAKPAIFAQIYGLDSAARFIVGRMIFVSIFLWIGYRYVVTGETDDTPPDDGVLGLSPEAVGEGAPDHPAAPGQ